MRVQILHDELEGLESSAQRAFDINALEGTVFDVSRTSLLVAVSRKHSETLDAVGPRGMWRCDKHIPQTTVERQIHVRGRCGTGADGGSLGGRSAVALQHCPPARPVAAELCNLHPCRPFGKKQGAFAVRYQAPFCTSAVLHACWCSLQHGLRMPS